MCVFVTHPLGVFLKIVGFLDPSPWFFGISDEKKKSQTVVGSGKSRVTCHVKNSKFSVFAATVVL
jgi:hypothetical protein